MTSVICTNPYGKMARCDYPVEGHDDFILMVTTQKTFQKELVTVATIYKKLKGHDGNVMVSEFQIDRITRGKLRATEKTLIEMNDTVDVDRYMEIAKEKLGNKNPI